MASERGKKERAGAAEKKKKLVEKVEKIKKRAEVKKKKLVEKVEKPTKGEKKPEKAVGKKPAKKEKEKKVEKPVKSKKDKYKRKGPGKSKEVKSLRELAKKKKKRMFRGRFGKRNRIRKISKKKWQRWRKPRGIDIDFKKEDGLVPGTGYRTNKKVRFVHPSGFREKLVRNVQEIEALEEKKNRVAARIAAAVGRKKRQEMLKKADEIGVFVLNR